MKIIFQSEEFIKNEHIFAFFKNRIDVIEWITWCHSRLVDHQIAH